MWIDTAGNMDTPVKTTRAVFYLLQTFT